MNTLVLFASLTLVAMTTGSTTFERCPNTVEQIPETVNVHQIMGNWFILRKGPMPTEMHDADCMLASIWKELGDPDHTYKYLHHVRKEMKHYSKTTKFELIPKGDADGTYVNNFSTSKTYKDDDDDVEVKVDIQEKFVETDVAHGWSIWAACITKGDNSTLLWSIKGREPSMDPMMEQMLVEKVEKYGGVGPSQLRGIGQDHCN